MSPLAYYILFCGIWSSGNGLLHDIAVLNQKRKWDRELIRLMIDGHILLFGGVLYFLCCKGIDSGNNLSIYVALANAIFLMGYCVLIFKMLPSYGTILVNVVAVIWLLVRIFP